MAVNFPPSRLEEILRRDRHVVVVTLVLVAAFAWAYTVVGVGMEMNAFEMSTTLWSPMAEGSSAMWMGAAALEWNTVHAGIMLAMWWFMMVAMMLPSAAPTILLAAAINRRSNASRPPYGAAGFFTAGYLLVWLFFSAVAVAVQWALESSGLLSTMLQTTSSHLTAGLLLAAGFWQLTPMKQACLRHCRSPVAYLTRHRRPGNLGALVMGMGHGMYCLGCCWFLMTLLFVGGVMNLYWIVGLALFVLAEKVLASGVWFARAAAAGLIMAGAGVLAS